MGEPAFLSEAFNSSIPDPDIELVTTAGHGKNGALCLLQQSVRPQVRWEFKLSSPSPNPQIPNPGDWG